MRTDRRFRAGFLTAFFAGVLASAGCSTMNNTEKGAGIGGALGAGAGLAVGAATGNPRTGAAVGGLLGAGTGALVGNDIDRQDKRDRETVQATAAAQAQVQQRLGMSDVIHMAQQGHDEQIIINQIRSSGSTFQLAPSDLDYLKNNSVSPRVIAEMQAARGPSPLATRVVAPSNTTTVIYQEPVYVRPAPVLVVPARGGFYGGCYRRW